MSTPRSRCRATSRRSVSAPKPQPTWDALLDGVLRGAHGRDFIKVDAGEARRLTLAIGRLCIDSVLMPRSEAGPLNAAAE
jgi:hypothetical protein